MARTATKKEPEVKEVKDVSKMNASEAGIPIEEYAKRVMDAQSADLPVTFCMARVEAALKQHKYDVKDIMEVVTKLSEEWEKE